MKTYLWNTSLSVACQMGYEFKWVSLKGKCVSLTTEMCNPYTKMSLCYTNYNYVEKKLMYTPVVNFS